MTRQKRDPMKEELLFLLRLDKFVREWPERITIRTRKGLVSPVRYKGEPIIEIYERRLEGETWHSPGLWWFYSAKYALFKRQYLRWDGYSHRLLKGALAKIRSRIKILQKVVNLPPFECEFYIPKNQLQVARCRRDNHIYCYEADKLSCPTYNEKVEGLKL